MSARPADVAADYVTVLEEDGEYWPAGENADAEAIRSFINRLLRLASLAPDIVEAALEGRQPKGMLLEEVTREMPSGWDEQRGVFCEVAL